MNTQEGVDPPWRMGILVSAGIVAIGLIASVAIREAGGPVAVALAAAVVSNLAGALVMDLYSRRDGAVLGAMALLMLLSMVPLLWVADKSAWIRENPLTFGFILILTGYLRQSYQRNWPLYAVAVILGAAHILVSLI